MLVFLLAGSVLLMLWGLADYLIPGRRYKEDIAFVSTYIAFGLALLFWLIASSL